MSRVCGLTVAVFVSRSFWWQFPCIAQDANISTHNMSLYVRMRKWFTSSNKGISIGHIVIRCYWSLIHTYSISIADRNTTWRICADFDEKDLEHMKLIARTQAGWKLFRRLCHSGFSWGCWQVFGSLPLLADLDAERKVGTLEDLGGKFLSVRVWKTWWFVDRW